MNLTNRNYYSKKANKEFFSVSQYKDFKQCEAMAMAKINGTYQMPMTKALLVGSFVDAYFEGTLKRFQKKNPEIFTMKNELRSEFKKANEIINRVKNDPMFSKFMSGKKQIMMQAEVFGVPWKVRMDSYVEDKCIVDLKVTANFRTIPYWRYDLQGAMYQKVVEINTGNRLPFYLAPVTKERVPDFDIFQITQQILNEALSEIELNLPRYVSVKNGLEEPVYCGKCDYCKSIKVARLRNYNELLEERN